MQKEHTIIIGAGPCGLSCAIELQKENINPLIIEKGCVVNTLYHFPTHQTFFSSSEKLEIGDFPFVTEKHKPVRNEALTYYREVIKRKQIRIQTYEEVCHIKKNGDSYVLETETRLNERKKYVVKHIIIATGYYDTPNLLNIPGEKMSKVMHYFKEGHPYCGEDVVVIGGKNSAVDTSLELYKAGANITVLYRGSDYSKSVKPWILPQFDSLVRHDKITLEFNAKVKKITNNFVYYNVKGHSKKVKNDFVFAMTGYQPNLAFLRHIGIEVNNETGRPSYNPATFETNLSNIFVAGVVISGFNTSETFIENGRLHGKSIAQVISQTES